jgi:hypothetical protein
MEDFSARRRQHAYAGSLEPELVVGVFGGWELRT